MTLTTTGARVRKTTPEQRLEMLPAEPTLFEAVGIGG